jgi:DNA gyrase subunit B
MPTLTAPPAAYDVDDIEILSGLEPVRKRPSMYIGGVDARGLHHLVWEIVDNAVDEYLAGAANRITVTLHKDGTSITVTDNGRGIPVGKHPKAKKSTLEVILTTLHAGGKFSNKSYARSGGLHGVGSSVVNALSSELVATVHRDGHEYVQRYKRGRPTTPVKQTKPFRGSGTIVFFRPDEEIFKKTHFNPETIRTHLEDIAYVHGGLTILFSDETHGEKVELHHPDGIRAYLDKLTAEGGKQAVHEGVFAAERDDKEAKVEVVLRWTEATDEQVRSYVNGIRTHGGGTHEAGLRTGIARAVKNYMEVHSIKPKGVVIDTADVREGIVSILSVFHPDPMFQGQTKEKLNNPEVAGLVEGLVRPQIETWLNANASVADAIVGRIVLSARARAASRAAVSEIRKGGKGKGKVSLPGKLLDCRSKDPGETELFIVEGDSAGGTAAMGRNSVTQAVLPLRGKILNTESVSLAKVMQNAEVTALVETLGCGIASHFDVHRLRYGRVILLMDADSDGYHISTLLLVFFFRHMVDLVKHGRLFIAQPPLYRIVVGKETTYARDDAEKEEILAALPTNKKFEVYRFKGLGEMDAKQLQETTLDPAKRTLLRVDVENLVEADETFAQLMGKDASERYKVIMEEASFADDLDV